MGPLFAPRWRATAQSRRSLLCLMLLLMCSLSVDGGQDATSRPTMNSTRSQLKSLMQDRPALFLEMIIRVIIATILVVNIDAFLKAVATPILVATGIGAIIAPVTFFMGQALQPIIHSVCFFHFDDRFVFASLEATGAKGRLVVGTGLERWHKMGIFEKIFMRYGVMKVMTGAFVGLTGIFSFIPIVGPILTALVSGWAVAWDTVYVPLSGMGYVGIWRQGRSVWSNFGAFYWFGFWAVLVEEIPIVGPACHVYNVYSAASFLERVYLSNNTQVSADGLVDTYSKEL